MKCRLLILILLIFLIISSFSVAVAYPEEGRDGDEGPVNTADGSDDEHYLGALPSPGFSVDGGHCIAGAVEPSNIWYFAEGYTGECFKEYLCILNPDPANAEVAISFNGGFSSNLNINIPGESRFTIDIVQAAARDSEVSVVITSDNPIVAERSMYFLYQGKWSGGSCVAGSPSTSKTWYFAEGYTGGDFDQWLCVLNPGDSPANLDLCFQTPDGKEEISGFALMPHSRQTFKIDDLLGPDCHNSLMLESDQPVVAERSMYFEYRGRDGHQWQGGHCVMGATGLSREYFFAEGTTRQGFEEWLTLQNPNPSAIDITAEYQLGTGQGGPVHKTYTMPGNARKTIFVADEVGDGKDVSVHLSSPDPFLAERPMYFDCWYGAYINARGGHCILGATAPASDWYIADGLVGAGYRSSHILFGYVQWLCIQNPGEQESVAVATFYPGGSDFAQTAFTISVAPGSRVTVLVNNYPALQRENSCRVRVISGPPVIVERPMYFDTAFLLEDY